MAKGILRFFGAVSILVGLLAIVVGLLTASGQGLLITLPIGVGFLISGAPLVGFAQVIELLEEIARNTRGGAGLLAGGPYPPATSTVPAAPLPPGADMSAVGAGPAPRKGDHSMGKVIARAGHRGIDYRVHDDGLVTARLADGPYTWSGVEAFKAWADAQPRMA